MITKQKSIDTNKLYDVSLNNSPIRPNTSFIIPDESSSNIRKSKTYTRCIICDKVCEKNEKYICCQLISYHDDCIKLYFNKKKILQCRQCKNDITNNLNYTIKYNINYTKIIIWIMILFITAIIIASSITYNMMNNCDKYIGLFATTYACIPFLMSIFYYKFVNNINKNLTSNIHKIFMSFVSIPLIINPLILLITTTYSLTHDNDLSCRLVSHIFICINWLSFTLYIIISLIYFSYESVDLYDLMKICFFDRVITINNNYTHMPDEA